MKKTRNAASALAALWLCVWLSACDKLPENGDLDGYWQVTEVQFCRDGVYDSIVPMKEEKIFWAVQLKLISITGISNGESSETLCRFSHEGGQLWITSMYIHKRSEDILIDDNTFSALRPTGIDGNQAQFQIEALDGGKMQLKSDFARIIFRKF